ncbi:MAG: hypothetical protein JNK82_34725 [Myxococcaceae bacterium]|nr:hypothetical protein [Myxococcaceae bacterium]
MANLVACTCDVAVDDRVFSCATSDQCAEGYSCRAGVCAPGTDEPGLDAGPPDAGPPDAGPPDAGPPDAGPPDAGPPDAGPPDAGPPDAGPPDPCGARAVVPTDAGVIAVYCAKNRTLTIDGDLADWSGVPFTSLTRASAGRTKGSGMWSNDEAVNDADISGLFALQWDDQNLYLAGRITDDIRAIFPASNDYFRDDCFQPYIDGDLSRTVTFGPADSALLIRADNTAQEFFRATNTTVAGLDGGMQSATRNVDAGAAGWAIEISIPWPRFGPAPVVRGRVIGFDLIIDDGDDLTMQVREHFLIWAQRSITGVCDEPYCSSVAYGDAVLTGAPP